MSSDSSFPPSLPSHLKHSVRDPVLSPADNELLQTTYVGVRNGAAVGLVCGGLIGYFGNRYLKKRISPLAEGRLAAMVHRSRGKFWWLTMSVAASTCAHLGVYLGFQNTKPKLDELIERRKKKNDEGQEHYTSQTNFQDEIPAKDTIVTHAVPRENSMGQGTPFPPKNRRGPTTAEGLSFEKAMAESSARRQKAIEEHRQRKDSPPSRDSR